VKQVAASLPKEHQTVMFSATMNRGILNLADQLLTNPEQVESSKESTVATTIDHRVLCVDYRNKKNLLTHLLKDEALSRVLIFTRTKAMADTLTKDLRDSGRKVDAIHGDREQRVREKVLLNFRRGYIDVLVATDVAARGIDVPDISHVINYDMPLEAESYVHRVGRTGRAGSKGTALSLCETKEGNLLRNVERVIRQPVPVEKDHPFHAELSGSRSPSPSRNGKKFGGKPFAKGGRKPFEGNGFKPVSADGAPRQDGKKPFVKTSDRYRGDGGGNKQTHANDGENYRGKFKEGGYKGSRRKRAA
jgi:ATP-dependent RNA helicase RhlE